jgi:uncharacterized protein (DUF1778 family)
MNGLPMKTTSKESARTERLEARLSHHQKDMLVRAAEIEGLSLTEFVLGALTEAASRVVREQDMLSLTQADQAAFAAAISHPARDLPELRKAAADHRDRVE